LQKREGGGREGEGERKGERGGKLFLI